jgi:hypothetical protein
MRRPWFLFLLFAANASAAIAQTSVAIPDKGTNQPLSPVPETPYILHVSTREVLGRHTIHVLYYEGTPYSVALSLWVRCPGGDDWKLFDLRDFEEPAGK